MQTRRDFLAIAIAAAFAPMACSLKESKDEPQIWTPSNASENEMKPSTPTQRMPVVFVGHGSPMHMLGNTAYAKKFADLSTLAPTPSAVLAISAHWYVNGTYLTGESSPKTIHDFGGFPKPLYEIQYPARGNPDLAGQIVKLLGEHRASLNTEWGYDHGTYSVLKWMYPNADIPVIQLSVHRGLKPKDHFELARSLVDLREQGVLIVGSGNIVHNLRDAMGRMQTQNADTPGWASRFDTDVAQAIDGRDTNALVNTLLAADDGQRAHPSIDHWLPLIYAYGATDENDAARFPIEGFDAGSISMRSVVFGS